MRYKARFLTDKVRIWAVNLDIKDHSLLFEKMSVVFSETAVIGVKFYVNENQIVRVIPTLNMTWDYSRKTATWRIIQT